MRKYAFLALAALVLAGCAREPIIGKWRSDGMGGAITMEFKKGGAAGIKMDADKMIAQMPGAAQAPKAMLDKVKQQIADQNSKQKLSWEKAGKIYKAHMEAPGGQKADVNFKVEGDKLSTCGPDGGPAPGQSSSFTRAK